MNEVPDDLGKQDIAARATLTRILQLTRLPRTTDTRKAIVIELIDTAASIDAFISVAEHWIGAAMVTFDKPSVVDRPTTP